MDKLYVADTENNVPRTAIYEESSPDTMLSPVGVMDLLREYELETAQTSTWTWLWTLVEVGHHVTTADVAHDKDMSSLVDALRGLESGSVVYFHNLGYDGPAVLSHLLSEGYEHCVPEGKRRKPYPGAFTAMISDTGTWYQLQITFRNRVTIVLRDSLKILPFSVEAIAKALKTRAQKMVGSIDYAKYRDVLYEPTDTEIAYARNDVLVVAEALAKIQDGPVDLTEHLTIGAACMASYKEILGGGDSRRGKKVYDALFPPLDPEVDREIRKAYAGGWCYVNRENPMISRNQAVDLRGCSTKGHTYDVNSLYPFAMHGKIYATGHPMEVDPALLHTGDFSATPYVVQMQGSFSLKPGHLPFVQLKKSLFFATNEYPDHADGVELTMTAVRWELFQEHYEHTMEPTRLWVFEGVMGPFDAYIDFWYEVKRTAKNPVERMIAKLMLNNLYGKMAQGQTRDAGVPVLEDGIVRYEIVRGEARGGHIAAGAMITDYARAVTVRAAQLNYDRFLYADTDSLHVWGLVVGVLVNHELLGQWCHESSWDMARFVRQKCYAERVIAEDAKGVLEAVEPHLEIKAAGATALVKERLTRAASVYSDEWNFTRLVVAGDEIMTAKRSDEEILERFTYGVTEAGKLRRKAVVGGVVLEETTFRIHPPAGVLINPKTGLADTEWTVVS